MRRPRPHGLTRSVQDRLRNLARGNNRPYAELLHLWALERYLYRLSRLPDNDRFVLKGALMMRLWQGLAQWQAFVRKSQLQETALSLSATVTRARQFLMPAVQAAAAKEPFAMNWAPGGPWQPRD